MITLLDRIIPARQQYTYCMSLKAKNDKSYHSHMHFVKVLQDIRSILTERVDKPALGKRKHSFTIIEGPKCTKAIKPMSYAAAARVCAVA